jgi:transposase
MDRERLLAWLDQGLSLDEIAERTNRHPATISYWLRKHGLEPVGRMRHSPIGPPDRSQLTAELEAGRSIREIAERLGRSGTSVRYWIARWGLANPREPGRVRPPDVDEVTWRRCRHHGPTEYVKRSDGHWRCRKCTVEQVASGRRRRKELLVAEAGGSCAICSYNRSPAALHFHHVDPGEKSFAMAVGGRTRALATLRQEAAKCVLLCANCHAEVEDGSASLPALAPFAGPDDPG